MTAQLPLSHVCPALHKTKSVLPKSELQVISCSLTCKFHAGFTVSLPLTNCILGVCLSVRPSVWPEAAGVTL